MPILDISSRTIHMLHHFLKGHVGMSTENLNVGFLELDKNYIMENKLTDADACGQTQTKTEVNLRFVQSEDFREIKSKFHEFRLDARTILKEADMCVVGQVDECFVHCTFVAFSQVSVRQHFSIRKKSG